MKVCRYALFNIIVLVHTTVVLLFIVAGGYNFKNHVRLLCVLQYVRYLSVFQSERYLNILLSVAYDIFCWVFIHSVGYFPLCRPFYSLYDIVYFPFWRLFSILIFSFVLCILHSVSYIFVYSPFGSLLPFFWLLIIVHSVSFLPILHCPLCSLLSIM